MSAQRSPVLAPEFASRVLHDVPIDVTRHFDRRDTWPMLLGMDYIEHHHLWLSYSTNALYIDSGEKKPAAPAQVSK